MATTIGAGNSFLAMMMIGLMLEIKVSHSEAYHVVKIIVLRIAGTLILSGIIFIVFLSRSEPQEACFSRH